MFILATLLIVLLFFWWRRRTEDDAARLAHIEPIFPPHPAAAHDVAPPPAASVEQLVMDPSAPPDSASPPAASDGLADTQEGDNAHGTEGSGRKRKTS